MPLGLELLLDTGRRAWKAASVVVLGTAACIYSCRRKPQHPRRSRHRPNHTTHAGALERCNPARPPWGRTGELQPLGCREHATPRSPLSASLVLSMDVVIVGHCTSSHDVPCTVLHNPWHARIATVPGGLSPPSFVLRRIVLVASERSPIAGHGALPRDSNRSSCSPRPLAG